MIRCSVCIALLLIGAGSLAAADRWRISFSYDKPQENFDIADFVCPAPGKCMATGALEHEGKFNPYAVITSDGGTHWTPLPLPEIPLSMFFLNPTTAWIVGEKAIFGSRDGGATWKKLSSSHDIERVYFLDENRGFAVGDNQALLETSNGGSKWTEIRALEGLTAQPAENSFHWIFFSDDHDGIVIGEIEPTNESRVPSWLEPRRRHSTWLLLGRTSDGGASWKFTRLQRTDDLVDVHVEQKSLWFLFQPSGTESQSEVTSCDWHKDALIPLVTDSDALLADAVHAGDRFFVAAISRQGRLMDVPIPGKLRIFSGPDFDRMTAMDVDYRAEALRARFAVAPDGAVFLATDTGMILRLVQQP